MCKSGCEDCCWSIEGDFQETTIMMGALFYVGKLILPIDQFLEIDFLKIDSTNF
jgi:hypoxanthine-guanine phosphoribosyltransferase